MGLIRCIALSKGQFYVHRYDNETGAPSICVLLETGSGKFSTHELPNGFKIKFMYSGSLIENLVCEFLYENILIKRIEKEYFNLHAVVGYINKFNVYSEKELETLAQEKAVKIKPQLQQEIEELHKEKETLEKKIITYKEVFKKVAQIKTELLKIE